MEEPVAAVQQLPLDEEGVAKVGNFGPQPQRGASGRRRPGTSSSLLTARTLFAGSSSSDLITINTLMALVSLI
jgi:hypothetical protein